jgi:hypothetical protein
MDSGAVEASSSPFREAALLGLAIEVPGVLLVSVRSVSVVGLLGKNPTIPTIFATTWIVRYRLPFRLSESGLDNLGSRYSRD